MFNPSITERLIHRFNENTRKIFAPGRKKCLNNWDFTIISNNCWGVEYIRAMV